MISILMALVPTHDASPAEIECVLYGHCAVTTLCSPTQDTWHGRSETDTILKVVNGLWLVRERPLTSPIFFRLE